MRQYKSYPAYKDSDAKWLGQVPEHWKVSRLASIFDERRTKVSDKDYPALSITKQGVVPQLESVAKTDDGDNRRLVCKGDIAINSRSDRKGSSGLVDRDGSVSLIITVLKLRNSLLGGYAHHLIRSEAFQEEFYRVGNGLVADLWTTSYSSMREIKLALPPVDEQEVISTSLDRETARIDALITKKTRFIELLREKRQAVITHAVTKGLDPNVKMKDSGVEWLGEVPEHWGIQPLKQLARLDGGAGFPDDEQGIQDAPIPFFKVADLSNGMTSAENYITPETADKLRAKIFPAGTIAFAKVGAALLLNRRVLMPIPGCADNNMMVAIPHGILGTWLHAVLSCYDMAWLVNPGAVPSVNQEQVGNIKIPVPSVEEQRSIVASVSSGTMRIDRIVVKTERSIELLKERRTAIITAAVTGQIDLREAS